MTYMEILFHISTAVAALGICLFCYLSLPLYENIEPAERLFQKQEDEH
jgi:cytochrome c-type biogenesis protein CcmH/NrfG